MRPKIDIVVLVDVIGALSERTAEGNVWMVDGADGSTGQGTHALSTACHPGQLVQWTVRPVDLQTPVEIRSIRFGDVAAPPPPAGDDLSLNVWAGVVPPYLTQGTTHPYRLELQMYEGEHSVLVLDTPSLRCVAAP